MAASDLIVRIFGDTKGLEASFRRANAATATFGRNVETTGAKVDKTTKSLRGFATGAAAGFAGAVVFNEVSQQIRAAVDVASNLQEQIAKSNVIFGESANIIVDWSKTTADSIGVARDQAVEAAATFGSMFDAAGKSAEDAAQLSIAVVQLAGDLASFNNTSVDDALTALRSGLSGEIEPLRRFQVFLTEAAVAAQAMADSGKSSAAELTQGEKIIARWNLILQQTTKAQGDAARTSESYANQTRQLAANMRDLQAQVGGPLLKVMNSLVKDLLSGAEAANDLATDLRRLSNVDIPFIDIPLNIKLLFGGKDADSGPGKQAIKTLLTGSLPGIIGLLNDAVRGKGIFGEGPQPNEQALAKQFASNFTPFLEGLEKGAKDTEGKGKETAKRIAAFGEEGFKPLTQSVKQARDARNKILKEMQQAAAKRRDDAAEALLAGLGLNIDKAQLTTSLRDDLAALEAMRRGLEGLIRQGQDVANNQSRLVAVIGQIADTRSEIEVKAREAVQRRQFRALGLDFTGEEIIPGVKNLQTRIQNALRKISSGDIDVSSKLVERLKLARKLIKQEGAKLTAETRDTINQLIQTVTQGADKLTKGPLTKETSLNANKILNGLGLGRDMEKELRARLSSFNSAGRALAGAQIRTTGGMRGGVAAAVAGPIDVTLTMDGAVVARNTLRRNQAQARRNPRQKRGPNSGV